MRVKLNLSHYFDDYRSTAIILVNDEIQTIKQFKNRISVVLNIKHFYLKCDDCYLPSRECIAIIGVGDIIWVCPKTPPEAITICKSPHIRKNDKKRFRSNLLSETNISNGLSQFPNCISKSSTPKEPMPSTSTFDVNATFNKKQNTEILNINNGANYTDSDTTDTNVTNTQDTLIVPLQHKTNIVPTIKNSTSRNFQKVVDLEISQETESEETSTISVESLGVNFDKRKRRRGRTRKSKKSLKSNDFEQMQLTPSTVVITPNPSPSRSHIRFDDSEIMEVENNLSSNIVETTVVISEEKQESNVSAVQVETVFLYDKITEAFLLKRPLLSNYIPKVKDVLAFKVLHLDATYSPIISTYIAGEVIHFAADTNVVTLNVYYGADQCIEPEGKFSNTVVEESETGVNHIENKPIELPVKVKHFVTDLMQCRLLFP